MSWLCFMIHFSFDLYSLEEASLSQLPNLLINKVITCFIHCLIAVDTSFLVEANSIDQTIQPQKVV